MSSFRKELISILIVILIISVIFVLDLFIHQGQSITFDGTTHISNIAQVYGGLKEGEFPVQWGQGFARYGMPIPLIAQQVPSYVGAFINLFTQNVILSYNVVIAIGAFVSTFLLYYFLRLYVKPTAALAGALLFHFAPYRIMNVYIRGAVPEFFSSIFIILVLIGLYYAIEKNKNWGYILLTVSVALLLLTHPFMLVVSSVIFIPYGLYLLSKNNQKIAVISFITFSGLLGIGLAGYYLVPLFLEIKYFNYGLYSDHFTTGHFLSLDNFYKEDWYYFLNDVGTREHRHLGGIIETIILLVGLGVGIMSYLKKKQIQPLHIFLLSGILYLFFLLPLSEILYQKIIFLGNIQHPWRMLTGYIFIAPIIAAFLIDKTKYKNMLLIGLVIVIAVLRFPQLYGKNYTDFDQKRFFVTEDNLHGEVMHTLWMGKVRDYPYKDVKGEIIDGKGVIDSAEILNSKRKYVVQANSEIRMVDNTFYFPGWKAYVDGVEVPIEFQDMNYRGMITYKVPAGNHEVLVIFEDTKVRLLGKIISVLSVLTFIFFAVIIYKKIDIKIPKNFFKNFKKK